MTRRLAGLLLPLVTPAAVSAQERFYDWRWDWHPGWWLVAWWVMGIGLLILLFWALVVVGFIVGLRWLFGQGGRPLADPALTILRERYARGEISREEFEAKRRD